MRIYLDKTSSKEYLLGQKINQLCISLGINLLTNEARCEAIMENFDKLEELKKCVMKSFI